MLNACRAWRFAADRMLVSKIDGGRWALGQADGADRALITTALARQRSLPTADLDPDVVGRFVQQALSRLD